MIVLRSLLFNLVFFIWTAAVVVLAVPFVLGPRRAAANLGRWWSGTVLSLLRRIVGLDYELRGSEHLPRGAVIVAIKHQSAWDTMAAAVLIDDPAIVLKRELLWIPFYGWLLGHAGMIAIDRGGGGGTLSRLLKQARPIAAAGRPIAIFPEGTRTAVGTRRPYLPGVAALYLQLKLPVVPVALNSGLFWGRRAFLKRPGRIVVEFLPPIPPGLERRVFEALLQARIEAATAHLVAETRRGGIG